MACGSFELVRCVCFFIVIFVCFVLFCFLCVCFVLHLQRTKERENQPNWVTWDNQHKYILTGQLIMYTSLLPGWTHFCLHSCFSSTWHRFNAALEILVRDFSPFSHDIITQLLHNCLLHIHDGNLLLLHIPKVLYWLKI